MLAQMALAATGFTGLLGGSPRDTAGWPTQVAVELASSQVVVTVGPLKIPGGTHYHHAGPADHAAFLWPEDGWVQGYRIDVVDTAGIVLPRTTIHHAGVANLSRRQLAYPMAQRLFAVGRETEPVTLPEWMGLPMSAGDELMAYFALVNDSDEPIRHAFLRIALDWMPRTDSASVRRPSFVGRPTWRLPRRTTGVTNVMPLILNADPNPVGDTQFALEPGVSTVAAEVVLPLGGHLRAAGGHMHDHARELRLEDVATGDVLLRLGARLDEDGHILRVEEKRFPFKIHGIRLEAGRRYRIVGVYDNPTGRTLPKAGMAYLAGAFVPDDLDAWPPMEPDNPLYRTDLAGITGEGWPPAGYAEGELATDPGGVAH